jgi:hypothetical protein
MVCTARYSGSNDIKNGKKEVFCLKHVQYKQEILRSSKKIDQTLVHD